MGKGRLGIAKLPPYRGGSIHGNRFKLLEEVNNLTLGGLGGGKKGAVNRRGRPAVPLSTWLKTVEENDAELFFLGKGTKMKSKKK